jgi:5'-3' exonuclease
MILLDFNGIAMANILPGYVELDIVPLRNMILNSIRIYRKKFRNTHGEIVICCDAGNNWRKKYYPEYKYNRKIDRDKSDLDWPLIFEILNTIRDELIENFPYKVVQVDGCEADDIIATMVHKTQEFGQHENVVIISVDKDFTQLQKYQNVKQFSPVKKTFLKEPAPHKFLFEQICRGDGSDGVPNVLSLDDHFVTKIGRQASLHKNKIATWFEHYKDDDKLKEVMGEDTFRNFLRNRKMIDLAEIPEEYVEKIINTYESANVASTSKVMPYFIKHRCRNLLEVLGDFTK